MSPSKTARENVINALRMLASHDFSQYPDDGHHPRIDTVIADAGGDAVEAYSAAWQLVSEGVIVPGAGFALANRDENDVFKAFPYFSITAHGRDLFALGRTPNR